MITHSFDNLPSHEPKGHEGFINRRLAGSSVGSDPSVSISHATIEPGGTSTLHVHDTSVQIYIAVSGNVVVGTDQEEHEISNLGTAIFEKGTPHFVENRSPLPATVLVVTSPELQR